ncbi:MAG: hypothetical protein LBE76_07955 [Nitrososphaerota archaeon]|nr:hypothetical protein [Nitrososphaerota archaeon]
MDRLDYAEKLEKLQREIDILTVLGEKTPDGSSKKSLVEAIQVLRDDFDTLQRSLYTKHSILSESAIKELKEYNEQNNNYVKAMSNANSEKASVHSQSPTVPSELSVS